MVPNLITFTLKKRKIQLLFLGAFLAALFGGAELYLVGLLKYRSLKAVVFCLAIASFLFMLFFIRSLIFLKKENFTGIYISEQGINDISTGNYIGTVIWEDVEEMKIMEELGYPGQKYIVLKVRNPLEYINREPIPSKRRTLELKLQYYGSPICFSNRALNCTFEQLKDAVYLKYSQYKDTHLIKS